MKKAVTIKDMAEKLNMSFSTISKALNNDPAISPITQQRVKQLAAEWNYIPNEAARRFKLKKTFTIGLVIPDLMDQFYVQAINGAEHIASQHQYQVITSQTNEDIKKEDRLLSLLQQHRVDGLIIAASKNRKDLSVFKQLESVGIPVVLLARLPKEKDYPYIAADNTGGAFLATEALIRKGHTRIAHLMGPKNMPVSQARLKGYKAALKQYKILLDDSLIHSVDLTKASVEAAMKKLMALKTRPSAIFCFKNYMSLDAIAYLKRYYPAMADEIDFAGFGRPAFFDYLDIKPVVSIEEDSYHMGMAAANMLLNILQGKNKETIGSHHIEIPCQLYQL